MHDLNFLILYDFFDYLALFILYYILAHSIVCAYLYSFGVPYWFLAVLPFVQLYLLNKVININKVLAVSYILLGVLSLLCPVPFWILWRIVNYVKDYEFAKSELPEKVRSYVFLPFYRYIWMFKKTKSILREEV